MRKLTALIALAFAALLVAAACGDGEPTGPSATGEIAFASCRAVKPADQVCDIYVMNADGSGQTRLTNKPEEEQLPVWSPDGSRIAFISVRDGNAEIYVMQADGTLQTRLTSNAAGDFFGAWSPDGTQIPFLSPRDAPSENPNNEIYVMNAAGSGQPRLTNDPASDGFPAWSPDGRHIAFTSNRD